MNILIAPNAFKGSLSGFEAADIIASAFQEAQPHAQIAKLPVADGGDGTTQVLNQTYGGQQVELTVQNPIGKAILAPFYLNSTQTAIIELADASGLRLLQPSEYDALQTSTFGTGQLLKEALHRGARRIILGIGGSATNDVGMGLLKALGVRFLDDDAHEAQALNQVKSFDLSQLDPKIWDCELIVPCDVDNPLIGECGAASIFAPQKGASPHQVELLKKSHLQFANLIEKQLGIHVHHLPYTGAAGGTAAGLLAFLNAKLVKGSSFVLDELNFDRQLQKADLVITGEGQIDEQTSHGKAPHEVALRVKQLGKRVIAFGGSVALSNSSKLFDATFSICNKPMTLNEAMLGAKDLLYQQAFQVAKLLAFNHS